MIYTWLILDWNLVNDGDAEIELGGRSLYLLVGFCLSVAILTCYAINLNVVGIRLIILLTLSLLVMGIFPSKFNRDLTKLRNAFDLNWSECLSSSRTKLLELASRILVAKARCVYEAEQKHGPDSAEAHINREQLRNTWKAFRKFDLTEKTLDIYHEKAKASAT